MLFGKKDKRGNAAAVHQSVTAALEPIAAVQFAPQSDLDEFGTASAVKARVESPQAGGTLEPDHTAELAQAGFVVVGDGGGAGLAFVNDSKAFSFGVWSIQGDPTWVLSEAMAGAPQASPAEKRIGVFVAGAAAIPGDRVLLSLVPYVPRPSYELTIFDLKTRQYTHWVVPAPDIRVPSKFFSAVPAPNDAVLVVYGTERVRRAAEFYYNEHEHFVLFSSRFPGGLEVLTLNVDQGSVRNLDFDGTTMRLRTTGPRDPAHGAERYWSLNLQSVLVGIEPEVQR